MTWKSTVLVSGAGLLATWLASVPSPSAPLKTTASAARPASAPAGVSDEIAQLADRLERRNAASDTFNTSSRNPFRFGAPHRPARRASVSPTPVVDVAPEPARPAMHLSGVAMDRVAERDVWTAIISTATGVVLAHEGEQIGPGWTVTAISAESVGLTRPDGSTVTLPLSGK